MKRFTSGGLRRTLALLIFVGASVFPLHGQETRFAYQQRKDDATNSTEVTSAKTGSSASSGSVQSSTKNTTTQPFVFPTRRQRLSRYVKSTVGPSSFVGSAITAGIDQWRDHPDEWEQGAKGYGKRYASDFGRNAIQQTVIYGLDSALGMDTKFRKSTRKGFFPRMADALAENVTSRNRSGGRVISVPRITGVYTAQVIKYEGWFPERFNYKDGLRSGTRSLATGFAVNLLREFVFPF